MTAFSLSDVIQFKKKKSPLASRKCSIHILYLHYFKANETTPVNTHMVFFVIHSYIIAQTSPCFCTSLHLMTVHLKK